METLEVEIAKLEEDVDFSSIQNPIIRQLFCGYDVSDTVGWEDTTWHQKGVGRAVVYKEPVRANVVYTTQKKR